MYQIKHHGAVDGVTGSCHELTLGNGVDMSGVLIDCGLFQGVETGSDTAGAAAQAIDFPVEHIRALIVTHCHIDHVGRIPHLLAAGFDGPIYCTPATAELLPLVLEDAVRVGFTRDQALLERFIVVLRRRLRPLPYGEWVQVQGVVDSPQVFEVRLGRAGHILGSAYVQCRVGQGLAKSDILFSGDLGGPYTPLLPAPRPPYGCDELVIESTYGDRLHQGRRERQQRLRDVVGRALQDRGTLMIPAFSIGRTQELLYEVKRGQTQLSIDIKYLRVVFSIHQLFW